MNRLIIFLLLVFAIELSSCYYDAADLLYPTKGICDTASNISYKQTVVPILQQQCYGCHTSASTGGGIIMGTHATDHAIAINGKLYGSISHASGFSAMPKGAAKMSTCQLLALKKWIDAGAQNN